MPLIFRLYRAVGASACLLLASCGGGGGGGAPAQPPPSPPPVAQTISFSNAGPVAKTFGDAVFTNAASGGAGVGAITYSSGTPAVATVDAGGQITIVAAGSSLITANKAADPAFLAATASYTLNVVPAAQSIGFAAAGPVVKIFGDAAFANLASGGAGTGAISYSSGNGAVAAVVPDTGSVTITGAGTAQISADKAADANHLAAHASFTLNVGLAAQSVTFASAGPLVRTFGDAPFSNAVTVVGGAGAVTFSTGNHAVAAVDAANGTVTIAGAGSALITATKAADNNHTVAQAAYSVQVERAPQVLSFSAPGPIVKLVGDATFTNAAAGGAGTGAITYASNNAASAAVNAAGTVTLGVAGSATITATKAASANHLSAQANYLVELKSPVITEAGFTAWLNLTDTQVALPSIAAGATFARAYAGNCPTPLSTDCQNTSSTLLGPTALTDTIAGLGRSAQYWLQRGATKGRPVLANARRFRNANNLPIEFAGQLWLVGANDGAETWSTVDGRAWNQRGTSLPWGPRVRAQVVQLNNRFYFIGGSHATTFGVNNDVWASDDGLTWTRLLEHAPFAARDGHQVVTFNGRLWLIGGGDINIDEKYNDVWSSADGVTWTLATGSAPFTARRDHRVAVFRDRLWVIGGGGGQYALTTLADVWSSADGVNWRVELSPPFGPRRQVATLAYGNRLYVLGGSDGATELGDLWSTADGSNWTQDAAVAPFGVRAGSGLLPYRGRIWLIGGADHLRPKNEAWSTTDFTQWTFEHTSAPFSPAAPGRLVSFKGRLWLVGVGSDGKMQAWSSADGDDWTQSPGAGVVPARNWFTVAVNNNRLYLQGGYVGYEPFNTLNDVWSTADGATWTQATAAAPFEARYANEMFALNGKLFVAGGEVPGAGARRDVWSSTDGATWQLETAFAAFGDRLWPQIALFNGRVWLTGGYGNNPQIFSSADGINWQLEGSSNAAMRYGHRMVVHHNLLWMIGGDTGQNVPLGDAWSSPDGITWTQQLSGEPGFSPRSLHGLADFGGKLWLYGGEGVNGENDSHEMLWSIDATNWRNRYHNLIEVP